MTDYGQSPRLIVLGAGYVGRCVADKALRRGWRVSALTWNQDDARALLAAGVDPVVTGPIHNREWHGALSPAGAWVLNCVGSGRGGLEGYRQSYLEGMRSAAEWASRGGGARAVVFTGSTSVYGQGNGRWVSEKDEATGGGERGKILREAEDRLLDDPTVARRRMILRLGGIYGPGRAFLLQRARLPELLLDSSDHVYLNSIRLEDICDAVLTVFQNDSGMKEAGVLNAVDDEPTLKSDILAALHARLGELGLLDAETVPPRRRSAERPNRRISNSLLKELYGWRPLYPSWKDGYADLLDNLAAPESPR